MANLHVRTDELASHHRTVAPQLRLRHGVLIGRTMRPIEALVIARHLIVAALLLAVVHLVQIHLIVDVALKQTSHRRSVHHTRRIVRIADPHLAAGRRQQTADALLGAGTALQERATQLFGGHLRWAHIVDGEEHVRQLRDGVRLQLSGGDVVIVVVDQLVGRFDRAGAQFAALQQAFLDVCVCVCEKIENISDQMEGEKTTHPHEFPEKNVPWPHSDRNRSPP